MRPEVIALTVDGEWWVKESYTINGWLWRQLGGDGALVPYSSLPEIVETYQPSSVISELVRDAT